MNLFKKLAGETAIYGLPSILGRFLGYLMVAVYTRVFSEAEYGTISVFYSYTAFLMVILTYGMETSFFRYFEKYKGDKRVFSTALMSLVASTAVFMLLGTAFSSKIASWIEYPQYQNIVIGLILILAFDVLAAIPFSYLRSKNKAGRFAFVKLAGIISNILLNLFFLLLLPGLSDFALVSWMYVDGWSIEYIFLANVISSLISILLLSDIIRIGLQKPDMEILGQLLKYGWPLLFAGLAGIVNETLDRLLLKYILPPDIADAQVGIYSACYKISIIMTLFIQAYRYAAEPFFFKQAADKNAPQTYARLMNLFVIVVGTIFLGTLLYLDIIILFIDEKFRSGEMVIPVLLLANAFLGIYYNLSVWYKVSGKTKYAIVMSLSGGFITIILNIIFIPYWGYMASAIATLACYAGMMLLSFKIGAKKYPIPYNYRKIAIYMGLAILLYFVSLMNTIENKFVHYLINTLILSLYLLGVLWLERPGRYLKNT